MKRIRFLADYQGYLTGNRYYVAGTELMLEDAAADELIRRKFAVEVRPERKRKDKQDEQE